MILFYIKTKFRVMFNLSFSFNICITVNKHGFIRLIAWKGCSFFQLKDSVITFLADCQLLV